MDLSGLELSASAQRWTNVVLLWLGLGILAGLLARFILPGRHPRGAAGTLLIGILGSTVGLLVLSVARQDPAINPISPLGLFAAAAGAVAVLTAYRLFLMWRLAVLDDEDRD